MADSDDSNNKERLEGGYHKDVFSDSKESPYSTAVFSDKHKSKNTPDSIDKSKPNDIPKPPATPAPQTNSKDQEWDYARSLAINIQKELQQKAENNQTHPTSFKISKKNTPLSHSFIYANGKLFKKKRVIGEGQFSKVKELITQDKVKFIAKIQKECKELADDAKKEMDIAKKLNRHQGDFVTHGGAKQYQIQPHLGVSLESTLESMASKPVHENEEKLQALASGILKSVKELHDNNVIHCDLHAGNFMVNHEDGQPNIYAIDFGLSHIKAPGEAVSGKEFKGSFNRTFAAPEFIKTYQDGEPTKPVRGFLKTHSRESDVYQVGVLLKEQLGLDSPIIDQMMSPYPEDRPSLMQALESVKQMKASKPVVPLLNDVQFKQPEPNPLVLNHPTCKTVGALIKKLDNQTLEFNNHDIQQLLSLEHKIREAQGEAKKPAFNEFFKYYKAATLDSIQVINEEIKDLFQEIKSELGIANTSVAPESRASSEESIHKTRHAQPLENQAPMAATIALPDAQAPILDAVKEQSSKQISEPSTPKNSSKVLENTQFDHFQKNQTKLKSNEATSPEKDLENKPTKETSRPKPL